MTVVIVGNVLNPLSIWLVTTGEPLEADQGSVQMLRTGRLATFLAGRGHSVTWWTSRFDHRTKRQRPNPISSRVGGVKVRLIDSPGYARNVSLRRLLDHRAFAVNFLHQAAGERRPDIVVASLPTVDAAEASVKAGVVHRCPTVIDIRDQWPDLIVDQVAVHLRPLARVALYKMNCRARFALSHATAITGTTDAYVLWGLEKGGRSRRSLDEAFPIARDVFDLKQSDELRDGRQELATAGVSIDPKTMIVCFLGTLGKQFDIPTVIAAARELLTRRVPACFVIAGDGERRVQYTKAAIGLDNVIFTGQLSRAGVGALLSVSGAGVAPYLDVRNFRDNVPNKIVEYLSAQLPVITPLSGEVARLIMLNGVGLRYSPGSAHELSEAVEKLTRDVPLRQTLAENARKVFLERYDATQVHSRLTAYLERVVGSAC